MLTLNVIGYNPPVSNISIRGGGRGGGRELVVLFSVRASKNSKNSSVSILLHSSQEWTRLRP